MIKTLRTSGGDYNNIDTAIAAMKAFANSVAGMSEDWELHIQPGTTWNMGDMEIYGDYVEPPGAGILRLNGHSFILKTSPDGPGTTPARINMNRITLSGDEISNGNLLFQNLKVTMGIPDIHGLVSDSIAPGVGNLFDIKFINCAVYITSNLAAPTLFCDCGSDSVFNDCSVFITHPDAPLTSISIGSASANRGRITNSILCTHSEAAVNVNMRQGINNNVSLHNYGAGGITEVLSNGATAPDVLKVDPVLNSQVIQAYNDSPATMIARDATLATGSPCIGSADAATSELTDILGNSRA